MTERVLITGATGGLGKELASALINLGYVVFGVGRSLDDLEELQTMGVETLKIDLSSELAAKKIISKLTNCTERVEQCLKTSIVPRAMFHPLQIFVIFLYNM